MAGVTPVKGTKAEVKERVLFLEGANSTRARSGADLSDFYTFMYVSFAF